MTAADEFWMLRAIELAERGRGYVEPNPLVGAVIVRDGKIVGEGWHRRFGEGHAEVNALAQAGVASRGATLYVTLEPCCHHGKTPPCTDALLSAGVGRVVAALEDPFPQVAGKGAGVLRSAGVSVDLGVCSSEARRQNAPYLKLLSTSRPYVHAKWAMSLDGKIATRTGDSKWISNEASRVRVHELRGKMDGILVGIGTVLADDPLLTTRPPGPRVATRVILDSRGRLPISSRLVQTAREAPVLVVTSVSDPALRQRCAATGCELLTVPSAADGRPEIISLLEELGRRRWTNLLVEGGSRVFGTFFDLDLVDEAHVFVAPKLLGGVEAKTPVAGRGFDAVAQGGHFQLQAIETLENDVYMRYTRGT